MMTKFGAVRYDDGCILGLTKGLPKLQKYSHFVKFVSQMFDKHTLN